MKRIVIIGASSGVGRQAALDFAAAGWRVGIAARRYDRLEEIASKYPDLITAVTIDVSASDASDRFLDLIETIGGMDVLLYAAGCGWYNPELQESDDTRTIEVNVTGMTRICNAAYKYFKATANRERGRIAVITSIAATRGLGISAAYSASKAYQQKYLQALDQLAHMQHVNVGITDIRPGFIATDLLKNSSALNLPMIMPVPYAARLVEKAILRGRRIAVIDSRWAIVTALWHLVPGALWRHLAINFSK